MKSQDDIVTLTTPDGSDTIVVSPDNDWLTDGHKQWMPQPMTMEDIVIDDDCDTYTLPDFDDTFKWEDGFLNSTVKIGNTEITEAVAEKMVALIDMIEGLDDDDALKQLFDTQLGMNKIRGKNDET